MDDIIRRAKELQEKMSAFSVGNYLAMSDEDKEIFDGLYSTLKLFLS